jgi:chromosome segregation ATPase
MSLLYTMDGLLEVCKTCTKKDSQKPIHENCNGCQIYDQLRDIGKQLERRRKMTKITREEYLELKASGLMDKEIAKQVGLPASKISLLKNKWGLNAKTVVPEEVKPSETKTTHQENDSKSAEYEHLISSLRADLNDYQIQLLEKDEKIRSLGKRIEEFKNEQFDKNVYVSELQHKVQDLENIHAACEDVESELASLKEENLHLRALLKLWM